MSPTSDPPSDASALSDIAFTDSVKAVQRELGTREMNQRLSDSGRFRDRIDDDLARFIAAQESLFLGTSSADGRPYVQHRGGEAGFVEVIDAHTLRIGDRPGNRQYISLGNLVENAQAFLFMIDYETRTRIKIWGTADVEALYDEDGARAIVFTVQMWDVNCQKHLPELYRRRTVELATAKLSARIETLEHELARLRGAGGARDG